ncbi:MAG: hypothetical protein NTW74_12845 [Acidobacteria bacterium]|nr:hypothetical protein [Acidobacteriota bacterium]
MGIDELVALDGLKQYRCQDKQILLHEDHRWVLPMVAEAQERGLLPRPVRVVLFDRHTDAAEPGELSCDISVAGVMDACIRELSHHDDDWIVAGIRMGLLADVFIFGVDDRMGDLPKAVGEYGIFGRFEMPGKLGEVGVRAREVLDWKESPILLDIDLDCFAYAYRDRVMAWDESVFESEFGPSLPAFQTFIERAGLITVCREAGCCGGEENADQIWQLFSTRLLGLKT